eukprot:gene5056-8651_t
MLARFRNKLKPIHKYASKEIRALTIIQLVYRTIMVLFILSGLTEFIITKWEKLSIYFIFLTNQTFVMTGIYFLLGIFSCIQQIRGKKSNYFRFVQTYSYLLLTMNNIFIPPLYWILVYKPGVSPLDYYNFAAHAISALVLIIDVTFENFPIVYIDFFIVIVYGYGYLAWIYVYFGISGRWIYPNFNPKNVSIPRIIMTNIAICVAFFVGYFIVKFLMWSKLLLFGLLKKQFRNVLWKTKDEEEDDSEDEEEDGNSIQDGKNSKISEINENEVLPLI